MTHDDDDDDHYYYYDEEAEARPNTCRCTHGITTAFALSLGETRPLRKKKSLAWHSKTAFFLIGKLINT
jgi:hypothetical protein